VVVRVASGDREEPVRYFRVAFFPTGADAVFYAFRCLFCPVIGSNA
jgi:hypothetical protein